MHGEKARQGNGAQLTPATQDSFEKATDQWRSTGDFCPDRRRPVSLLVPRQQISGETHTDRSEEKNYAGEPGDFSGVLVGSHEKRAQHVSKNKNHHQACAPVVDASDQPAESYLVHDVLDARVGMVWRRHVINRQEDPGENLEQKQKQAGASQRIPPVDLWYFAIQDEVVDRG
jgi:hypothetical protein